MHMKKRVWMCYTLGWSTRSNDILRVRLLSDSSDNLGKRRRSSGGWYIHCTWSISCNSDHALDISSVYPGVSHFTFSHGTNVSPSWQDWVKCRWRDSKLLAQIPRSINPRSNEQQGPGFFHHNDSRVMNNREQSHGHYLPSTSDLPRGWQRVAWPLTESEEPIVKLMLLFWIAGSGPFSPVLRPNPFVEQ